MWYIGISIKTKKEKVLFVVEGNNTIINQICYHNRSFSIIYFHKTILQV